MAGCSSEPRSEIFELGVVVSENGAEVTTKMLVLLAPADEFFPGTEVFDCAKVRSNARSVIPVANVSQQKSTDVPGHTYKI